MTEITPEAVLRRYRLATGRRANWETLWQECFDFALPQRETAMGGPTGGASRKTDRLFDGTAPDAVDQLAASLLAQLTPPWARWFGLAPGSKIDDAQRGQLSQELEAAAQALQSHFDRSNFAVELHQCYLDLVTVGTASLMFEAAPPGEPSAFRFTAVPLSQVCFEEDSSGRLDTTFRTSRLTRSQILERFPKAKLPDSLKKKTTTEGEDPSAEILEAVFPAKSGFDYIALIDPGDGGTGDQSATVLKTGRFERSPFINFRWFRFNQPPGKSTGARQ